MSTARDASHATAAIVLAAGQGKRMRSERPKVLHQVCGAPMIHFPLAALGAIAPKVVVLGVGREKVEAAIQGTEGVRTVVQDAPRGTADAVKAARAELQGFTGDVVIVPGDTPCMRPETVDALLALHREGRPAATLLTMQPRDPSGYGRIVRTREGKIVKIVEERDASSKERAIEEVNAGMYAIRADCLWAALDQVTADNTAGEYYLTDVIRLLISDGRDVRSVLAPETDCAGVNDREQLAEATAIVRSRILHSLMNEGGVTIVDPANTTIEVDVSIGPDTVVEPFSVIRRGARIGSGCHIGPFAHISDGAVLEDGSEIGNFVEVKRTRVGRRAKAKHLAYLGDGDIGAGANIGAGTVFCNYDGKRKHRTLVGERAHIGSGSLLVAPVTVGNDATTGAGAVVTSGKSVPAGETWVGVPARPIGRREVPGG